MSNFIKAMANFKVSDVDIEKNRPKKYLIPQEKGLRDQAGSNTSSVNYSKYLEDVESYVELSEVQKIMLSKITVRLKLSDFINTDREENKNNPFANIDVMKMYKEGKLDHIIRKK